MEKLNIAELLKDCPSGMELDCTVYDNVTLGSIMDGNCYPIQIQTPEGNMLLSKYGCMSLSTHSKCVIFPKGKTTWEGFQRPFKDGDVIANNTYVVIFHKLDKIQNGVSNDVVYYHCWCCKKGDDSKFKIDFGIGCASDFRFATDKEKQKLFQAIKDNGYKWNAETKTLEKLPKFKVGDRIKYIYFDRKVAKVVKIHDKRYELDNGKFIEFQDENAYEISYDKFDINTLKPFDKVLVRLTKYNVWNATFFSHYDKEVNYGCYPFVTTSSKSYSMCIPYEGNEHLLGTTNDCDEFYKTWE